MDSVTVLMRDKKELSRKALINGFRRGAELADYLGQVRGVLRYLILFFFKNHFYIDTLSVPKTILLKVPVFILGQ